MSGINQYSVFLSRDGGLLDVLSPEGEILSSFAVPAGRVRASRYLDLVPQGCTLEVAEGLEVFQPPPRLGGPRGVLAYGEGSHLTGANPDFMPTSATRLEVEMRAKLAKLDRVSSTYEKRLKALDKIERIPDAPLIEPVEPEPVSAPAPADE